MQYKGDTRELAQMSRATIHMYSARVSCNLVHANGARGALNITGMLPCQPCPPRA
jgi:hypothetical protein